MEVAAQPTTSTVRAFPLAADPSRDADVHHVGQSTNGGRYGPRKLIVSEVQKRQAPQRTDSIWNGAGQDITAHVYKPAMRHYQEQRHCSHDIDAFTMIRTEQLHTPELG